MKTEVTLIKNVAMSIKNDSRFQMDVIDVEDFLRQPPPGFEVELRGTGYRFVRYNPESFCVFIDEFNSAKGKVIFKNSPGRTIKVHTLKDYMHLRKQLTSKRIVILVSACERSPLSSNKKAPKNTTVLKQYVVVINGSNPVIKWEMERGLDHTISSVAGESYSVKIDFSDLLQIWAGESFHLPVDGQKIKVDWQNTCFCLKYHSDALFDFSHWLGFSKREFKISYYRNNETEDRLKG
ncbi:hypothetical protein AGOR_G00125230 [Albula goreensis]|uniref:Mesenteric estrogen-dependent adipogenesis protein n=1 Tax=Albula goreensis TaxID=1534307 RepID=A0A8T3DCV0_9TELE|nr:hypothetical protein AGOR_G00125230 [Albula goreensis]